MSGTIGKVTALITRPKGEQRQLLLIRHPYAGIQIPAGTIEPGETPNEAESASGAKAPAGRQASEPSGAEPERCRRCLALRAVAVSQFKGCGVDSGAWLHSLLDFEDRTIAGSRRQQGGRAFQVDEIPGFEIGP